MHHISNHMLRVKESNSTQIKSMDAATKGEQNIYTVTSSSFDLLYFSASWEHNRHHR
jgi:hypothetical protein